MTILRRLQFTINEQAGGNPKRPYTWQVDQWGPGADYWRIESGTAATYDAAFNNVILTMCTHGGKRPTNTGDDDGLVLF